MSILPPFAKRHPLVAGVGTTLLALALVAGLLTLHAQGYYDVEVFSDLPENEGKLRAMARRALPPGPDGPGTKPTFLVLGSPHLAQDDDSATAGE